MGFAGAASTENITMKPLVLVICRDRKEEHDLLELEMLKEIKNRKQLKAFVL